MPLSLTTGLSTQKYAYIWRSGRYRAKVRATPSFAQCKSRVAFATLQKQIERSYRVVRGAFLYQLPAWPVFPAVVEFNRTGSYREDLDHALQFMASTRKVRDDYKLSAVCEVMWVAHRLDLLKLPPTDLLHMRDAIREVEYFYRDTRNFWSGKGDLHRRLQFDAVWLERLYWTLDDGQEYLKYVLAFG